VGRLDPDQPLTQIRTLSTITVDATARWRFRAQLAAAFALVALTLAVVGVFGLLAYTVQQRRREFVLRLAIGARRQDIVRLVMATVTRVTVSGIVIGVMAASILSRGMTSLLFGVQPLDGLSFSLATAILAVTALVAATGPVMRAMHLSPAATLRNDS
jgi:putative ABC transport system permease protein